jgi:hypothetical protein
VTLFFIDKRVRIQLSDIYAEKQGATIIPEKYRDPHYCETDSDCQYTIPDGCCGEIVNLYHKKKQADTRFLCNMPCPPAEIHDYRCSENNRCTREINCRVACLEIENNIIKRDRYGYSYVTELCKCD